MSLLLLLFLVLRLSNCASSNETVGDDLEKVMYKSEKLGGKEEKLEELEKKLEATNVEVENLQKQLKEMKVQCGHSDRKAADLERQFAKMESKMEKLMLRAEKKESVADLKSEVRAEVKKELDKVLPTAVEEGLKDLPYEMVCAYRGAWSEANSIVTYDQITVEFNNSDQPGGGDGSMNIETGVFTTVTSGYYIITFSGSVGVHPKEYTAMWLNHNGVSVVESRFVTSMYIGDGDSINEVQGSRTVVSRNAGIFLESNLSHSDSSPAGWGHIGY